MMTQLRTIAAIAVLAIAFPAAVHAQAGSSAALRREVDSLMAAMVTAFKTDPASVARHYSDDATIAGGGSRYTGRADIDRYWREATMFADWQLEVMEVGEGPMPWVRGRSTLTGKSGRTMVTEFIGLLKRGPDGALRFYVDMFVSAGPRRPPPA